MAWRQLLELYLYKKNPKKAKKDIKRKRSRNSEEGYPLHSRIVDWKDEGCKIHEDPTNTL